MRAAAPGSFLRRLAACVRLPRVPSPPVQCFEGLKAYVDPKGHALLFRPYENAARLNKSLVRLGMPVRACSVVGIRLRVPTPLPPLPSVSCPQTVSSKDLVECLKQLVKVDKDWIPRSASCRVTPRHFNVS